MNDLGRVRSELRRLGYLDDSVERYLLQDALRPERMAEALRHLAEKVALLVALPSTLALTWILGAVNGHVQHAPFDLLPLFFHLLLPLSLGIGLLFAVFGGLVAGVLRLAHVRRIETVSYGVGVGAAVFAVAVAVWIASALLSPSLDGAAAGGLTSGRLWWLGVGILPLLGWLVFRAVHGALLTLAIRTTEQVPERPRVHGRRALAALCVAAALALPIVLWASGSRQAPSAPAAFPTAAGERVLVIGVDGVLGREVEWSLAAGEAPTLAGLLADGGVLASLTAAEGEEPAARWTTLATGLPSSIHGLETLDGYLPIGMQRPLVVLGPLRGWMERLESTPLVAHRPRLAGARRAATFWELVARGGRPTVTVGWWGTYPASPIAGAMVSHGAHQLMAQQPTVLESASRPLVPGADATSSSAGEPARVLADVAQPESTRAISQAAFQRSSGGGHQAPLPEGLSEALVQLLPATDRQELLELAVRPDLFYREVFEQLVDTVAVPRVATLYLAGVEIAAARDAPSPVVVAELLRWQVRAVDSLVERSMDEFDAVFVAFDPGRRDASDPGRLLVWRRAGCGDPPRSQRPAVAPASATAAVLRLAGLPQSGELPEPPPICDWPAAPARVDSYGPRQAPVGGDGTVRPEEYLEQLRSLGYL